MRKAKVEVRECSTCGHKYPVDKSQCPSCLAWDSPGLSKDGDQTVLLSDVSEQPIKRIETGPWDCCFGTDYRTGQMGIVVSSVVLLGGVPGGGKSTMSLQLADRIAEFTNREVIYVGTEESPEQIKDRAIRLQIKHMDRIRLHPMGSNADLGKIMTGRKPGGIIVDSIPGQTDDPEMAVELCKRFKDYAVALDAPVILIDHVTKDGDLAGLMALQHAVDTLAILYRDDDDGMRTLETHKNRFGAAPVAVELEMTVHGLIMAPKRKDDEESDPDWEEGEEGEEGKTG